MAVYLSPGVFAVEKDLSALPINTSGIVPAFIGTANKGPLNTPTLITSSEQYIDTFGEPFPESYLGYAVLAYLAEGNIAYVTRIGIECDDGQSADLSAVCVDTSGNKIGGWGRIPLFGGIDYGKIYLRIPTADAPITFHAASVNNIEFNDAELSGTFGAANATLSFTGGGLSSAYTGAIDDSFVILITGDPDFSDTNPFNNATYQVIRNSDGVVISDGTLGAVSDTVSSHIAIGEGDEDTGLVGNITITNGVPLGVGDTFTFEAHPDNRLFTISIEGGAATTLQFGALSYTTIAAFVAAFNALVTAEDYIAVDGDDTLYIRTETAGETIQITGTEAWALEVGVAKWTYDIPRSYVIATDAGPFNINTAGDRVTWEVLSGTTRTVVDINVPVGSSISSASLANTIHAGGIVSGTRYLMAITFNTSDDDSVVVVMTDTTNKYDQLKLLADYSHSETIKFAENLGILYPYTNAYRVFSDARVVLPDAGVVTPSTPLSCENDPASSACAADSAYYGNIVGFLVATSPGTWLDDFSVTLRNYTNTPGLYELLVYDNNGILADRIQNFTFDSRDDNFIASKVNPGTQFGGTNGNKYVNWEDRPSYLDNDDTVDGYEPRLPGLVNRKEFDGMANGIPSDATQSADVDAAIIGNPARGTGLYTFSNSDKYDISLLCIPGVSSGSVIAAALQFCESRGDCVFLVDPPFGLRPQQMVDWHNGILFSDLANSLNSSYGALYWSWVKVFDQFNRTELFVPPSGHIAAVFARTARVAETWFAPAGLNRGRLITALALEYVPSQGERDAMYGFNNAINPIADFTQDGIVVWGQRTLQRNDTALDRVNVRMLLIAIKKSLRVLLRQFIFEPNDKFLRAQVTNVCDSFMSTIAAKRGVTGWKVICNDTNNTPARIDRNEMVVSILIKPTRAAEFIELNLAVLRTDQSFSAEEVLQAAGVA
jgi:phage tail sheath protein FI